MGIETDCFCCAGQQSHGSGCGSPIAIADPLPAGLESGHWTCAGARGTTTSGSLPLAVTLDGLGPQASATFTLSAVAAASGQGTSIINTATATPTAPELCLIGQAQCSASADSVQINPSAPATPTAVPSLSQWGTGTALIGHGWLHLNVLAPLQNDGHMAQMRMGLTSAYYWHPQPLFIACYIAGYRLAAYVRSRVVAAGALAFTHSIPSSRARVVE